MAQPDIGTKLRSIRAARGWNQGQLSVAANVAREIVSYVESGRRELSPGQRARVEAALGYGLDDPHIEAAIAVLRNNYSRRDSLELMAALASRGNGNG